jgi:hypothetical protein
MLLVCLLAALQSPLALKPAATLAAPALNEVSGVCPSSRTKGVFWVENDSGDSARIFAIDAQGRLRVAESGISIAGAKNVDWEEVVSASGKIYICDMGNNDNSRRDLGVYLIDEPKLDRREVSAKFLPIAYPDQTAFPSTIRHFDCEAAFFYRGKLHFLTKHRMPNGRFPETGTNLYRLETESTERTNVLKKLDSKSDMGGWVTAASTSPDGRYIAVLTHSPIASIWIFDSKGVGDRLLGKPVRYSSLIGANQCEAICWDGRETLMVINEQRQIFRIKVSSLPLIKAKM